MLSLKDFEGRSLAAEVAIGGDEATFEAVSSTICESLQPQQVVYPLFSTHVVHEPRSSADLYTSLHIGGLSSKSIVVADIPTAIRKCE